MKDEIRASMVRTHGAQAVRYLLAMRWRLTTNGWTQGTFGIRDGKCCLVGAGRIVASPYMASAVHTLAWDALHQLIQRDGGGRSAIGWNDVPGRTLDDVLALIDEAIASLSPVVPA